MTKEEITKYAKAFFAVLAAAGVFVAPENQDAIVAGFLATYAVVSAVQGRFFKSKDGVQKTFFDHVQEGRKVE